MGLFVSKLLSNDVGTLDRMFGEMARAIREGQWEHLMRNDSFWSIVSEVASNPATLSELRGYVSGLLEEDWRTSSMLLDMLSPGMTSTQRRVVISVIKLELFARTLRSEVFWNLALDRDFVTAVWKYAVGMKCSIAEEQRMQAPYDGKTIHRAITHHQHTSEIYAHHGVTAITTLPTPNSSQVPFVPPPPLARLFTVLTLPSILALLQDITRTPPDPPIAVGNHDKEKANAKKSASKTPLPTPAPTASPPIQPIDSKTNLILLIHRDLLKLDHIFDRERAAVAPVPGGDPNATGLGMDRKTYILIRGIIKFMLIGCQRPSNDAPLTPTPQLSLFARLFLDRRFQETFLTKEFLSHVFQQKLAYFLSIFPNNMAQEWFDAEPRDDSKSDHPQMPVPSMDEQFCHSLRAYGSFFIQFFADPHVTTFVHIIQRYDELCLEHLFEVLYMDIVLPLLRPEQYVHEILTEPSVRHHHHTSSSNGHNKSNSSTTAASSTSQPSKKKLLRSTPVPMLPPSIPIDQIEHVSKPWRVPSAVLITISFVYHWLFEPIPTSIIQQSKAYLDQIKHKGSKTQARPTGINRLRDVLMKIELYQEWSRILAASTTSSSPSSDVSSMKGFNSTIHALVYHSGSLATLDYLQTYAPHIAFCLSKAMDELNMLWRTNESATNSPNEISTRPLTTHSPTDMFAPQLSFHGPSKMTITSVPTMASSSPSTNSTQVPNGPHLASVPAPTPASSSRHWEIPPSTHTNSGLFSSLNNWIWGSSKAATEPDPEPEPAPIPLLLPPPLPIHISLAPQLISPRSRFDIYVQHQLRLWCSRVLEGRGFTLFTQQQQHQTGLNTPTPTASSKFVFQGQSQNGSAPPPIFPPLNPNLPILPDPGDIFYVELLFFDPVFIEKLLAFAFTYEWVDQRDQLRRMKKQEQEKQREQVVPIASTSLSSTTSPSSSLIFYSPLYPLVSRNMSNPKSTPIDLGPIRTREYIALISRELLSLLQEDHIANFLNRSEPFWKFLIDTRWWDIISDAKKSDTLESPTTKSTAEQFTSGGRQLIVHPRVPVVSPSKQSALYSLLALVSNKESSYYHVLLELGNFQQFHDVFSDANISHVLSLLRLVCSWQVHEIMTRYDEVGQQDQKNNLLSSQDFYSTLTAPFTFWGIVHSLSVVTPLRQQYKGAMHWFLSKRNMEMQVEIWKVVKEILYGDEHNEDAPPIDDSSEVPAPAPLHQLSHANSTNSPVLRQKIRLRRLHSLAQICKSVHGSGIIQAIFTFPLATAHFYAVNLAEYLWPTRRLHVDAYFPKKEQPVRSSDLDSQPSGIALILSQLWSLLYTMAKTAEANSFLNIPTVRTAFLEWVNVALEEMVSYGSGEAMANQERARMAKEAKEREKAQRKEQERLETLQRKQDALHAKLKAESEKEEARKKKNLKRPTKSTPTTSTSTSPSLSTPSTTTTTEMASSAPDMFSAASSYRISASLEPENIPPRFRRESEIDPASSAKQTSFSPSTAASSSNGTSTSDDVVSLPPPFAFERTTVDEEDDERGNRSTSSTTPPTATAANVQARSKLTAEPAIGVAEVKRILNPDADSAGGENDSGSRPAIPSLPQRHRLLYSFFQLVLSQKIFKTILTSASFWEMLSDVSFLEIITSLVFGTIEQQETPISPPKPTGSRQSTFQAAKTQIVHTTHLLAAKRAQLKLIQKLFAHYRFKIFMAELKTKQFELEMSTCMSQLLNFLNSTNGQSLLVAVLGGLREREKREDEEKELKRTSQSRSTHAPSPLPTRLSLSSRFVALTGLLSNESTIRLLTAPRFWLLFSDTTTLEYFSNGQYLRLWLHQQQTIKQLPVWELLKRKKKDATKVESKPIDLGHDVHPSHRSKREVIAGFVKKKLTPTTGSTYLPPSPQTTNTDSTTSEPSSSTHQPPPPSGLLAIQHFITLIQAIYALIVGHPLPEEPIRSRL